MTRALQQAIAAIGLPRDPWEYIAGLAIFVFALSVFCFAAFVA
jgi:hypothetical protein